VLERERERESMEGEEGGGIRLSKRIANGEVDYKTKSGTAWSHSYLNQKPWHPLSYPNQRRKWIAEQTHANRQRRTEEVSREVHLLLSSFLNNNSSSNPSLFASYNCSSLRSKSSFAKPLSSPKKRRKRSESHPLSLSASSLVS